MAEGWSLPDILAASEKIPRYVVSPRKQLTDVTPRCGYPVSSGVRGPPCGQTLKDALQDLLVY